MAIPCFIIYNGIFKGKHPSANTLGFGFCSSTTLYGVTIESYNNQHNKMMIIPNTALSILFRVSMFMEDG